MAQLKFYKSASAPAAAATGAVWFDTTHHTIQVKTATGWDKYAGALNDATWDGLNLTITKHDGSSIVLNFSDFASASGVTAALAGKLAIGTAADAAGTQSYHGLKKDIEAAQAAAVAAAKVKDVDTTATNGVNLSVDAAGKLDVTVTPGSIADGNTSVVTGGSVHTAIESAKSALSEQINNKNVSAEPANGELVTASASNNKVTVGVTTKLTNAVAAAETAVQPAALTSAIEGVTGTLNSTDARTLKAINTEIDNIDQEIENLKIGIAGAGHFKGIITTSEGVLPNIADTPNSDGSYTVEWHDLNQDATASLDIFNGDFVIVLPYTGESQSADNGKEYIFVDGERGTEFVELGDLSPANQRLTAIENSYVKSVATTDGTYVKLTPDSAAKNEVVVTIDDTALATKLGEIEDAIEGAVAGSVASIGGQAGIITLAAPTGDGDITLSIGEDKQLKAEINDIGAVIGNHIDEMLTHTPLEIDENEDDLTLVSARGVKSAVANAKAYTDSLLEWAEFN